MIFNFAILFSYLFIILFSVLGYGLFVENLIFKKKIKLNLGYLGLLGLFFIIIYSYISHFFTAHNYLHNTFIILLGLIFTYNYLFKRNQQFWINILILIFLILFISLLIYKTHDDFPYYHFPYSYYLTQNSLLIGVGQFNHGFRTPSSLFYLNSIFYLPLIKFNSFYIATLLFMGFSNLILINNIFYQFKEKKIDYIFYFSVLIFIFINIFFYRLQEHGTDRSAQILIFILFLEILLFIKLDKYVNLRINHILLLIGLIVSLKAFYVLYFIIFIPLMWILYKNKKFLLILKVVQNKLFYFFLFLLLLIFITYFFNTGCILYPVHQTCFENLSWSLGSSETIRMNAHYQLWSKAGLTPISKVENPSVYIENFNWVSNWISLYFFNKVSDFLFGLMILSLFILAIFYKKKKKKIKYNKNIFFVLLPILLLLIEWFYNHPALRYGGYVLIAILTFIPISLILEKFDNTYNNIYRKLITLLFIVMTVFISRNALRINDEIKKYNYQPFKETFYKTDESHFRVEKKFKELIQNYENCKINQNVCNIKDEKIVKKFLKNRYIFKVIKND